MPLGMRQHHLFCRVPKGTHLFTADIPAIGMAGYQCQAPLGLCCATFGLLSVLYFISHISYLIFHISYFISHISSPTGGSQGASSLISTLYSLLSPPIPPRGITGGPPLSSFVTGNFYFSLFTLSLFTLGGFYRTHLIIKVSCKAEDR